MAHYCAVLGTHLAYGAAGWIFLASFIMLLIFRSQTSYVRPLSKLLVLVRASAY